MVRKGFTIIEILIVLSILVILGGIVLSVFQSFNKNQALDGDTRLVQTVLERARNDTLTSKNATQYGVHFSSQSVTIFTGSSYSSLATDNQVYSLSSYTALSYSFSGGGSDVVFQRLTGETSQTGTITLTVNSQSKIITLYGTGITSVQ